MGSTGSAAAPKRSQAGCSTASAKARRWKAGWKKRACRCSPANRGSATRPTRVADTTPGLFNSGYFVLSALDGTPPKTREAVSEAIDLHNGGQAATMLVISDYSFNTPGSIRLNKRLNRRRRASSPKKPT